MTRDAGALATRATIAHLAVPFHLQPSMRESHIPVRRTARYFVLGEPSGHTRELWIVCHGHGQLAARFLARFEPIAAPHRLIVAPEALQRYYLDEVARPAAERRVGATWMTREDRLTDIADNVAYLDALAGAVRAELPDADVALHLLGFSQGVATVMRWIAQRGVRPAALTLWAGPLPPDVDPASLRDQLAGTTITLVLGDRDEFAAAGELARQAERLRAAGLAVAEQSFTGGHALDADTLRRLAGGS